MVTDKYGNDLRTGHHVADLRKGSNLRGKVITVGFPPTDGDIPDATIDGIALVKWNDTTDEEIISAKDIVVTDTIHIRRRRG